MLFQIIEAECSRQRQMSVRCQAWTRWYSTDITHINTVVGRFVRPVTWREPVITWLDKQRQRIGVAVNFVEERTLEKVSW